MVPRVLLVPQAKMVSRELLACPVRMVSTAPLEQEAKLDVLVPLVPLVFEERLVPLEQLELLVLPDLTEGSDLLEPLAWSDQLDPLDNLEPLALVPSEPLVLPVKMGSLAHPV